VVLDSYKPLTKGVHQSPICIFKNFLHGNHNKNRQSFALCLLIQKICESFSLCQHGNP